MFFTLSTRQKCCFFFQGNKLWGGRFTGKTDPLMEKFNESLSYDRRMWQADIRVSRVSLERRPFSVSVPFIDYFNSLGSQCSQSGHFSSAFRPPFVRLPSSGSNSFITILWKFDLTCLKNYGKNTTALSVKILHL